MFTADIIYISIKTNSIHAKNLRTQQMASSEAAISSRRLLVGNFTEAESTLKKLLQAISTRRWLRVAPTIVIQPLEMTEEGLSQIEERIFRELALAAGAAKAIVHVGEQLSDEAALALSKTR